MATKMPRRMVSIDPEFEDVLVEIKSRPEFCMKSVSEVIRYLMRAGADAIKETKPA